MIGLGGGRGGFLLVFAAASSLIVAPLGVDFLVGAWPDNGWVASAQGQGAGGPGGQGGASSGSAGAPVGGSGASVGPGPQFQQRPGSPRFRGDRYVPGGVISTPATELGVRGTAGGSPGVPGGAGEGRCDDVGTAALASDRVSGRNLGRLKQARNLVAPGLEVERDNAALYVLANYQEELEKSQPDATVAGTYLGLVSRLPIDTDLLEELNFLLCVASGRADADAITRIAERQRLSLRKP